MEALFITLLLLPMQPFTVPAPSHYLNGGESLNLGLNGRIYLGTDAYIDMQDVLDLLAHDGSIDNADGLHTHSFQTFSIAAGTTTWASSEHGVTISPASGIVTDLLYIAVNGQLWPSGEYIAEGTDGTPDELPLFWSIARDPALTAKAHYDAYVMWVGVYNPSSVNTYLITPSGDYLTTPSGEYLVLP